MPEYSAKAFKWTGTYYNALYETSYDVTIKDDDAAPVKLPEPTA